MVGHRTQPLQVYTTWRVDRSPAVERVSGLPLALYRLEMVGDEVVGQQAHPIDRETARRLAETALSALAADPTHPGEDKPTPTPPSAPSGD